MKRKPISPLVWALLVIDLYLLLYAVVYAFQPWGDQGIVWWTTINPILTSLLAATMAGFAWRETTTSERSTWKWLCLGMGLWVLGEISWAVLSLALGQETPYPSIADLFYLGGYVPIILAIEHYLSLARSRLNWLKVAVALAAGLLMGFLSLITVVELIYEYDAPRRWVELVLNIVYPVVDAIIATGGILALLAFTPKSRWQPWVFIGGALVLWAFSDLWFSMATWQRTYDTGWMAVFAVDLPYTLAYLLIALGCAQAIMLARQRPASLGQAGRPVQASPNP